MRYANDRKSEEESAEKNEEEMKLINMLEAFRRKRKEDLEEEAKITKELSRIREKQREAVREEQLNKKKEEKDSNRKIMRPKHIEK